MIDRYFALRFAITRLEEAYVRNDGIEAARSTVTSNLEALSKGALSEAIHNNADLALKLAKALRDLAEAEDRYDRVESSIFDTDEPSAFDARTSSELAIQCRMQARDTGAWGTDDAKKYEAFMLAVAKRLENAPHTGDDPARRAVLGILDNLCDRRGIKRGFEGIDDDVRAEIVETLTSIVVAAYKGVSEVTASTGGGGVV